jgi:hypothetical protein
LAAAPDGASDKFFKERVFKMDFIDELKQFCRRVETLKDSITTEEATKTSIVMPFFQLLGYDVFNPQEFLPEFTADVGIKKGEKVDYAILKDGKPIILIEAKWCGDNLDKYDSQLYRYFGTTEAKISILTNGIVYKFFSDVDEQNKMDKKPFLEFNILDLKESYIPELKKFHKDNFEVGMILNTASDLKYSTDIKQFISQQIKNPSDDFIKYILGEVYSRKKTQGTIDKFREVVKKSLNQFMTEFVNDRITTMLNAQEETESSNTELVKNEDDIQKKDEERIITTEEELEGYFIIKQLLMNFVPKEKISHKDTGSYFGIIFDNNIRKWICRLNLDSNKKYIIIPNENKIPVKYQIQKLDDIYNYKDVLINVLKGYLDN